MSIDTTVSQIVSRRAAEHTALTETSAAVTARIEEEVASVRDAEDKVSAFNRVLAEHPEDALAVACRLGGLGGAR